MNYVLDIYALCNIMNFKGNKDPQDVSLRSLIFPWSETLSRDSNINWGKWIPTRIFPSQITHVDLFVYLCNVDIYFDFGICKLGNKFSKMLEDYCWCCFINCCKYFGCFHFNNSSHLYPFMYFDILQWEVAIWKTIGFNLIHFRFCIIRT